MTPHLPKPSSIAHTSRIYVHLHRLRPNGAKSMPSGQVLSIELSALWLNRMLYHFIASSRIVPSLNSSSFRAICVITHSQFYGRFIRRPAYCRSEQQWSSLSTYHIFGSSICSLFSTHGFYPKLCKPLVYISGEKSRLPCSHHGVVH